MKYPITFLLSLLIHICAFSQSTGVGLQLFGEWQGARFSNYEQRVAIQDTAYASTVNRLASLYRSMGSYEKAEILYWQALNIRERSLGKKHPDYAVSLNNLALLYKDMGNYRQAEGLYLEAIEVIKNTSGTSNLSYATTLNNLATLYRDNQNYKEAEPIYMEALTIFLNILGDKKHASHGITLNNVAVMFRFTGNYTAAESLQNRAIEIIREVPGEDHPSYATAINNLALLHQDTGNCSTAEELFGEALAIRKRLLGQNHPSYANSVGNLADFYHHIGNHDKADSLYRIANDILFFNINQQFGFMSEKEKELYLKTLTNRFDAFNSFSLERQNTNPSIVGKTYNNILKNKGLLLKSGTAMRNATLSSDNEELIEYYKNWVQVKQQITHLTVSGMAEKDPNFSELQKQANELEKKLVRHSTEFSDLEELLNIDWRYVKSKLNPGEAAIEFTHFQHNPDSMLYCALIIKHDSDYPVMVPVFEENELERILMKRSMNNFDYINSIYGRHTIPNRRLHELAWQPLEKHLKDVKAVYISPSGLLHKISFAAINTGKNKYLLDDYNIRMLSTTAKTGVSTKLDFSDKPTVALFGGIQYSIDSDSDKPWAYLKGTLTETETIKNELKNIADVKIVSNTKATVSKFKELATAAEILHIATHGFFFPDPDKTKDIIARKELHDEIDFRGGDPGVMNRFINNNDPLMRSGLVFAGVNDYWNGKKAVNDDDGVLTALEVINIDLRNNKLVVMSACESGLGDIVGSEGVYGLQRAFKMAGTDHLIISLWQIPDKETAEFMKTFYGLLTEENDLYKAFSQTQKTMRMKYDPFFWAGFVLTK